MKRIKLLIIGYSKFVEKRLIKSIKKIKKIDFRVCSKSKKKQNDLLYGLFRRFKF